MCVGGGEGGGGRVGEIALQEIQIYRIVLCDPIVTSMNCSSLPHLTEFIDQDSPVYRCDLVHRDIKNIIPIHVAIYMHCTLLQDFLS